MNCPKCGVELLEHVSFCPLCGSALPDDLWQKRAARTRAPVRKPKKAVRPARSKTVTMRPTEPAPEKPRTVTMKPVDDGPKTVTMRPTEPAPVEPVAVEAAPGKPPAQPEERAGPPGDPPLPEAGGRPAQQDGTTAEPPEPKKKGAASGDTVDMLCPMCDNIVTIPVERPIHIVCPKCSEEYYFAV